MPSNTEKILRGVPAEEKVLRNTRRVSVVKATDCVIALSKCGFDTPTIKSEIQRLLKEYVLVRVKINENDPNAVSLSMGKTVNASDHYMWTKESYDYATLALSVLCVVLVLGLAMYRIWPYWLKVVGRYAQYLAMALLILILVVAFIRLVVFAITYFVAPPGLWLLPNLFAECDFLESFIPATSWGDQDVSHKKKS